MSDLLIIGMNMPESCTVCEFAKAGLCTRDRHKRRHEVNNRRALWCPLIEIPEHGNLLDKDIIFNYRFERPNWDWDLSDLEDYIDEVPVFLYGNKED